jgi:hypothetical protein
MRMIRLMLIACLLVSAGVSSATAQVIERLGLRPAEKMGTQIEARSNRFNICSPFELERRGIVRRVLAAAGSEILAGFDNTVLHGASCHLHIGFNFVGALRFNVDDLRRLVIHEAILRIVARPTNVLPNVSCDLKIEMATEDWLEGEAPRNARSLDINTLPLPGGAQVLPLTGSFARHEVNITPLVQRWALGTRRNFGLVIKADRRTILRPSETTCTSFLTPSMSVTVLRRL